MATPFLDSMSSIVGKLLATRRTQLTYGSHSGGLDQTVIENAYLGSGMMRKCIDIPAKDAVRDWREWQASGDDITAITAEEKRLGVQSKIGQAEILRRLGGGAIILGLPGDPTQPAPAAIRKGGLAFVHVVNRWQLQLGDMQDDPTLPGYGEPILYKMHTAKGQQVLHPSRVIPFRGVPYPNLTSRGNWTDQFWGESRVAALKQDVDNYDAIKVALLRYASKAGYMRVGIPNLSEAMLTQGGKDALATRVAAIAGEATALDAVVFDKGNGSNNPGEEITDAPISLAGIVDTINGYGLQVAAVADIPATRLLGQSATGLNASGKSEQHDWNKVIASIQTLDIDPCLDRLDRYLLPSAGVTEADYTWPPLSMPTQTEEADRFNKVMEAITKLQNTGAIPSPAFEKGVQSLMTEEGWLPGLDAAMADVTNPDDLNNDPSALMEGGDPASTGVNDSTPRPLYVRRDLLNSSDLVKWAKDNGLTAVSDMHVTILYSRQAVDPMAMGETWAGERDGGLIVKPGGPRALELFGDGALVLQFASYELTSRHADMIRAGATHDYPEYLPHVTITYQVPDGFDLDAVRPYTGELRFGPEIFEPLDPDWKSKIEEI